MIREPIELLPLLRELYRRLSDDARQIEATLRETGPTQVNRRGRLRSQLERVRAQRRACLAEIAARENAPGVDVIEAPKPIRTTAQLRAAIERARR